MSYIKKTKRVLILPYIIDLRGFSKLSSKVISKKINKKDYINWLKTTDRQIEYKTIKIRKDRISIKLRNKVFKRDNYMCLFCKSNENLSCDHIIPESKDGKTILSNLQTLCRLCNSKKGNKIL